MYKLKLSFFILLLLFPSTFILGNEGGNAVLKSTEISISDLDKLTKKSASLELKHVDFKNPILITLYSTPLYDDTGNKLPFAYKYYLKVVDKRKDMIEQSAFDLGQVGQIEYIARLAGNRLKATVAEYSLGRSGQFKNYEIDVSTDAIHINEVSDIPLRVYSIKSIGSWKDTEYNARATSNFRFRAISYDGGHEGMPYLVVEKTGARFNKPLYWKFRIDVTSSPETHKESLKLMGERSIGCCGLRNIRWDGLMLNYDMTVGEKIFECFLPYLGENKFDVYCNLNE